jgi:hypothetical protein
MTKPTNDMILLLLLFLKLDWALHPRVLGPSLVGFSLYIYIFKIKAYLSLCILKFWELPFLYGCFFTSFVSLKCPFLSLFQPLHFNGPFKAC